jgi:glycosyltransferase involved in cell wall biosynthesis
MRIALIAPPFITVPPKKYGGTELFVAELALALQDEGLDVMVYANGESTVDAPTRWFYEKAEWPISEEMETSLKGINHSAWSMKDAAGEADIIHLNSAAGLSVARFVNAPLVYTVHHAYEPALADFYLDFPAVSFVTISRFQQTKLTMPRMRAVHHGINLSRYCLQKRKQPYLSFLGRIAPTKGTHLAIEIARRSGMPLKIAGEIQPLYQDYWQTAIKPHVDGRFIEYVGEIGLAEKNELLGNSLAMLFPIQWDEPFGLVMIEAMACGTPVLALRGGSVKEVVLEGVSGCVRDTAEELAQCAVDLAFDAKVVRGHAEQFFSAQRMARDYIQLYAELAGDQTDSAVEGLVA